MNTKVTLAALVLLSLSTTLFAQVLTGRQASEVFPNAEKVWMDEETSVLKFIKLSQPESVSENNHASWLRSLLKASSTTDFQLVRKMDDKIGQVHYRYQQLEKGYTVDGAQFIIHTYQGQILSANGNYSPAKPNSFTPAISELQAFVKAKAAVPSEHYLWEENNEPRPTGELVINRGQNQDVLAYKFDMYSIEPLARYYVFVDAQSGNIVEKQDRIMHTSVGGTAHTKYHGIQTITTDSTSPTNYNLVDNVRSMETKDMNTSTNYAAAVNFTDSDNIWNTTTNQDDAALDAHWGAEKTYDFYFNNYGLDSYDGNGATINSYVHYSSNYVNAFWDGTRMTYGDGNGTTYSALTSIDIVAHEISHAVTSNSANLVYSYESGALNESFSDIFGVAVDFFANGSNGNWLIGDQCNITGSGFRNMANPNAKGHPDTYLGNLWYTGTGDNGGVHYNSGVQNFWFYLLVNGGTGTNDNSDVYGVNGIGMADAADIAYRNLTVYLTATSQYADARFYSIQSAYDLFGGCSDQEIATTNAWYAVGVGTAYSGYVVSNFETESTYSCAAPATFDFVNGSVNDSARLWIFGDGTTDTSYAPSHTYTNAGTYTVSLVTYSGSICGSVSDTLTFTDYITVSNAGSASAANCIPTATTGNSNYGIFNFSLNSINHTTDGASDGYQDYSCSQGTVVTEGDVVNISVNTGLYNSNAQVYIDYDTNGVFSSNEMVLTGSGSGTHSGNITIPSTAVFNTPIRVRVIGGSVVFSITSTCTSNAYQQIEDYSIIIEPVSAVPVADFVASQTDVYYGSNVTFTDLSLNAPTSYSWSFPGGTPSASTSASPVVNYPTIGDYNVTLVTTNAFGSDTLVKSNYIHVSNTISMCGAITSTTSSTGSLADDGGPTGNYSNNKNCFFLIEPTCADSITLSFSQFSLENGYDYVRVYDGTTTSGTQILNATGNSLPASVTATSGAMLVNFYSDQYVVSNGFEASWTTITTPAPVANFTVSNSTITYGGTVNFTDQSTNNPTSRLWIFGDGTTSNATNPSHTYNNPGTYTVQLVATSCGMSDTASANIVVQGAPVITLNPLSINVTMGCNETQVIPIQISNSGQGPLQYTVSKSASAPWTSMNTNSGNVGMGNIQNRNITINSAGLSVGTHQVNYIFTSNDTNANVVILPVTVTMNGTAELWVSTSCLTFGNMNQFVTKTDSFHIANTGCAPMAINGLTQDSNYTVSTSLNIVPVGDTATITLTYNPTVVGPFSHNLTITTNGNDSTICVSGTVAGSSIIEVSTNINTATMRLCENNFVETFVIKNVGLGNLFWSGPQTSTAVSIFPSGSTVLPGDSVVVTATFTNPGQIGTTTDIINITTNAPQSPSVAHILETIISGEPCVDFVPTELSACDGVYKFKDTSVGIVNSCSWNFGDGTSSTDPTPSHMYTTSGIYPVTLVVCGPNTCDTTNQLISVTVNSSVALASCYPVATNPTSATGITYVGLNSLHRNSVGSDEGYVDNSCSMGTQIVMDSATQITVHTVSGIDQRVKAWIDFNGDGSFTSGELIMNSTNGSVHTATFTSPVGVQMNTALRLRVKSDLLTTTAGTGACSNQDDGQTEDFYVVFVEDIQTPVAQYQFQESGDCSGTVSFVDQSQNFPTSWIWIFGDGNTSTQQNPTHQYAAEGTYSVQLVSTNSMGSDTSNQTVIIEFFDVSFTNLGTYNANQNIEFSYTGDADAISWSWSFGDGDTSNLAHPSHVYAQEGEYIITLVAQNAKGCSDTFTDTLRIGQPLAINHPELTHSVNVYPNPNNGRFTFVYEGPASDVNMVLYSLSGQTLYSNSVQVRESLRMEFDDLNLAPGMYFLQVEDGIAMETLKIIVQ